MDHLAYALAWAAFGLSHSALPAPRLARFGRWQRIVYNLIAVTMFALVAAVGAAALGDEPAFALPAWAIGVLGAVHIAGWLVLLGSARYYDLGRLAGTAQLRGATADEGLRVDGPHAFVRHPLYAGGYLILWGAALSPLGLATAVWGSLYLAIGTACEERRLLRLYGSAYDGYRARVPALVPWRGRAL
jgi:methanethiol S-methyltransferase